MDFEYSELDFKSSFQSYRNCLDKAEILVKPIKAPESFGKTPVGGCSRSEKISCSPPIKSFYGTFEQFFLFDKTTALPIISKPSNIAGSIILTHLAIRRRRPSEYSTYETHSNIDN